MIIHVFISLLNFVTFTFFDTETILDICINRGITTISEYLFSIKMINLSIKCKMNFKNPEN